MAISCYTTHLCRIEWVKDNITFNDNGTVSFLEKMIFHFDEENSAGTEDDLVTTVNVPFIVSCPRQRLSRAYM